jgi:LysR family hydrogen peroxide-inducible transcriptional activator
LTARKNPCWSQRSVKKIIEQIQVILFESKKIENIIQSEQKGQAYGELSLGVIPTVAPYLLPKILPVIEKMFPQIKLNMQEMQTSRIIEALNNDEIDVGLLATPLGIEKLHEHALFYEPFSVLCKKGQMYSDLKTVKYTQLSLEQMWLMEEGHCLRNQVVHICSAKKKIHNTRKYQFESGSLETLKNLVDACGGFTLLPQLAADHIGTNSRLIPFERPIPAREIGLVYRRAHYKLELIESLAETIIQSIPESVRKIRPKDLNVVPVG